MSAAEIAARLPEVVSTLLLVAYLGLAMRQSLWCWPAALASAAIWATVSWDADLLMDAGLQVFYFAMAIYGWVQWRRGGADRSGVRVHRWPVVTHVVVVAGTLILAAAIAYALRRQTDAAFPFLDSWTTLASIVTTFMVTRKVIENWIYWFVIDAVYVYLYIERALYVYAGLYLLFLVMVVFGFRAWLRDLEAEGQSAAARAAA